MRTIVLILFIIFIQITIAQAQPGWTHITEIDGQEIGYVIDLESGDNGEIWLSSMWRPPSDDPNGPVPSYEYFVFYFDGIEWHDESNHFGAVVSDINIAANGDVWFCFQDIFLIKFDGDTWHQYEAPIYILRIAVSENDVWCCSNHGVLRFDGSDWTEYSTADGLACDGGTYIVMSPEDEPWISHGDPYTIDYEEYFGISHYTGVSWETFNTDNGFPSNVINDIAFDASGNVFIAYEPRWNSGIISYTGASWESLSSLCGWLSFDHDDNLWVVTEGYRLYKYDGVSWYEYPDAQASGRFTIDSNDHLWFKSGDGVFIFDPSAVAVEEEADAPVPNAVIRNYSNPFNPSTTITYMLTNPGMVKLTVYSITGQKVATLVDGLMDAGAHSVQFNGTGLASGIYLYRFESPGFADTGKMLLVK